MSPQQQEGPVKFGDYYLMDRLAIGGMAEIWRGKAVGLEGFERTVALKLILPSYTQNPEFNSMFIDEARIASSLNHSNIVRITNFGVTDGRYYHEEEFIEGRSVRQILQKCHDNQRLLPIDSACYIISEICKGLHYAHTKHDPVTNEALNIIHRDMSPQNIMVSFEGEVKIVDWGIAKAKGKMEETRAGVLKGKFGYMSPEQAEGEELDSRTDIFSLGIVFYEAVTGERLFVADNEINTLKKIREGNVPLPSKVNPAIDRELEAIVLKMLARPRIERYQSCYDVHEDIVRYLHKKFPAYNSLKLSKFVKELFSTEILADRKRMSEKEQSMPSYSPLSYGSRPYEEKTRISSSDQSSYDQVMRSEDEGDRTQLADGGSKKEANEPTMATVSSGIHEKTQSSAPRPVRDTIPEISYSRSDVRIVEAGSKRKLFIRVGLVAVVVVLLALAFLMPGSKKTTAIKEQTTKAFGAAIAEQAKQETPKPEQPQVAEETKPAIPKPEVQAQPGTKEEPAAQPQPQPAKPEAKEQAASQPVQTEQSFAGKTGNLSLSSVPVNADVTIDGQSKGKTPLTLNGLVLGRKYELTLNAPGFETVTKLFTLRRENNNLVLNLTPSQSSGKSYISVDSEPPSQVFIDGKLAANFESVYMFEVTPGAHTIQFINKKLDIDYSISVNVKKGEHFKKNITLR
jgi:serine/threonine protein kinase